MDRGHAYDTPSGVYFDTQAFGGAYGKLYCQHHDSSQQDKEPGVRSWNLSQTLPHTCLLCHDVVLVRVDAKIVIERIYIQTDKRHEKDFALWKRRKHEYELFWASPWGDGRPGWCVPVDCLSDLHVLSVLLTESSE